MEHNKAIEKATKLFNESGADELVLRFGVDLVKLLRNPDGSVVITYPDRMKIGWEK